ncbi:hypothetical protein [Cupriavidus necator]|uniref:hypothetical protein n=1 Tax=Cupriavidus necator TaxID=106590 RepID=UPI00339D5C4E
MSDKPIRSAEDAVNDLLTTARATTVGDAPGQSAQEAQRYQEQPRHPRCADCKHLTSKRFERRSFFGDNYVDHRNLRCGLGGFRVTRTAVCDCFERAG